MKKATAIFMPKYSCRRRIYLIKCININNQPNGECDHGELCNNEGGEANGNDMDKLVFEEKESTEHDNPTLKRA